MIVNQTARNINLYAYRGRTRVYLEVSATDRSSGTGPPQATRDRPVLSADQAVDLALSPELLLFP